MYTFLRKNIEKKKKYILSKKYKNKKVGNFL